MTGQQLIEQYRTSLPHIAIEVDRTLDPSFRWDGAGPDPEERMPEVSGLWADLLNSALSEVDWNSIAESFLED